MSETVKMFAKEALPDGRQRVTLTDNPARSGWADTNYFAYCKWCRGKGCMMCPKERSEAEQRDAEPLFSFDPLDPDDMELAKTCCSREVIEKAFGFDGGGINEIKRLCAEASLIQLLQKMRRSEPEPREGGETA